MIGVVEVVPTPGLKPPSTVHPVAVSGRIGRMSEHEDALEIRRLRRQLGLTQVQLARAAGIAENTMGAAENPDRPSTVRERLLTVLKQMAQERGNTNLLYMPKRSRALEVRLGDRDVVDVHHRVLRPGVRLIIAVAADSDASDEDIQDAIDQIAAEIEQQGRHAEKLDRNRPKE